jgi:hypothetical protein
MKHSYKIFPATKEDYTGMLLLASACNITVLEYDISGAVNDNGYIIVQADEATIRKHFAFYSFELAKI